MWILFQKTYDGAAVLLPVCKVKILPKCIKFQKKNQAFCASFPTLTIVQRSNIIPACTEDSRQNNETPE